MILQPLHFASNVCTMFSFQLETTYTNLRQNEHKMTSYALI